MTRKLMISLLVIAVMSLMVGQGVVSFLSDTETSAGNTFSAGTIDLQVDDQDHPPALITLPDMKPCQEFEAEIPYQNVGTNPGTVTLEVSYQESDDEELDQDPTFEFSAYNDPGYEVSADDFAKKVYITKAEAHLDGGIVDLMPTLVLYAEGVHPAVGATIDGQVSIFEFVWQEDPYYPGYNIPRVWPLAEALPPGAGETLVMRFHLDGMADNKYQADGIVSTLDFQMMQLRRDPNLVMAFPLNEGEGTTAHDTSSHGNHGTIVDNEGDQWTSDPPYLGYALNLDGTDDYVQVSDSPSLQITNALTLEAWVNVENPGTNGEGIICKGVWGVADKTFELYVLSNKVHLALNTTSLKWANQAITTGWHHVVATYDGSQMVVYVDGVPGGAAAQSGAINTDHLSLDVGRLKNSGVDQYFTGDIDRVRVYDRALSPSEVLYSYVVSYSHYYGGP
jgi:predicted ribosomally synthesized peptide with SipW-like signal peptide